VVALTGVRRRREGGLTLRPGALRWHLFRDVLGVVTISALCALIEPFYPKPGNGRPPVGVERMLRIDFLLHWFNLSDPAVDEVLGRLDAGARRRVNIKLDHAAVDDFE
jgi:hypothetical protein